MTSSSPYPKNKVQNPVYNKYTDKFGNVLLSYGDSEIDVLMTKARNSSDQIFGISKEYADRFGGVSTPVNLKSRDSIVRKVNTELGGNLSDIKDSVRTTVIVEKDKIDAVYKMISEDPRFLRVKLQTPDKFLGYKGVLSNLKTNQGIIGEIQVNSPEMIFAKESPKNAKMVIGKKRWLEIRRKYKVKGGLGHTYYEEIRLLNATPDLSPEILKRISELEQLSRDYYGLF